MENRYRMANGRAELVVVFAIAALAGGAFIANRLSTEPVPSPNAMESRNVGSSSTQDELTEEQRKQVSLAAFRKVATVLRHPRCLNCHPSGDRPHVGDDRRLHDMNVQRGAENKGMPGLHCAACHQTANQVIADIPGAPHWQLAPRSMGWEGLDDHELAKMLLDRERNGNRSFDDLIHHMGEDPLVLWGWTPGGSRSLPPLGHEEFMIELKTWLENGAAIPHKGETTF